MKKNTLLVFAAFVLVMSSCRKVSDTSATTPFMHTTQQDLRSGNTSVVLSDARLLAAAFLQRKSPGKIISILSAETVISNGVPYLHIINANDGFVIVSADSLYKPVVAFSTTGNFSKENMNGGLAQWFNTQGTNIDYLRSHDTPGIDSAGAINKAMWRALGKSKNISPDKVKPYSPGAKGSGNVQKNFYYYAPEYVGSGTDVWWNTVNPMLTSTWGQVYPYNQYCPAGSYSGGHVPAGCVPVAMAQIMYYWQNSSSYSWSSMSPSSGTSEAARLIHDIGITTGPTWMQPDFSSAEFVYYDDAGSSANDFYAPFVFSVFGYPEPSRTIGIADQMFSGARNGNYYASLLRGEVLAGRPTLLSGYACQNTILGLVYWPCFPTGHTWVCDGLDEITVQQYDTYQYFDNWGNPLYTESTYQGPPSTVWGYLHMNWGWSGTNNGWFDYQTNYAYGSGVDQSYFQTVVYGIHP
jgi:hypothetical protein